MKIWVDEADRIDKLLRQKASRKARQDARRERAQRAKGWGWMNWYINRGIIEPPHVHGTNREVRKQLRQISWRRTH